MSDDATGPLARAFARHLGLGGQQGPQGRAGAFADLLLPPDGALPVPPATTRAVWELGAGTADQATLRAGLARAQGDLAEPWPTPRASTAARVHRDGDRAEHEALVLGRQHRLSRATLAAAATLEDRWLDEVADGLWQLCEQSSWCWPAHDEVAARRGWVLPATDLPVLDLGAGEVAGQLAWIDHLLGSALAERYPGLRERVRTEVRSRVLDPFRERRDWHWIGLDGDVHNWNPWIHGNVLVAALRLLDDPAERTLRAGVVDLVIEGLDRYVAVLPEDGAIDEGYEYWWNGACRAVEALDLLAHSTGGALDALAPEAAVPSLRATLAFPHRMHLGGPWYVNHADGRARPPADQPWHALHQAARRAGQGEAEQHAAAARVPGTPVAEEREGLGRLLRAVTDEAWCAAGPAAPPLPREVWLGSTQVHLAREHAGSPRGLTVVTKGGHNGEHHNHNDVGSVVVASDGVPVLVDAGRPTYTAQTFGPDRYEAWMMQSSWHTLPEVAGVAQGVGSRYAARDAVVEGPQVSLDLAAAYPVPGLRSWRREVRLDRDLPVPRVLVRDSWDLDPSAGPGTCVHLILAGQVTPGPDGATVQPLDGATPVRVTWPEGARATLEHRTLDDPMLTSVWGESLTRVRIDADDRSELTVEITQTPEREERA